MQQTQGDRGGQGQHGMERRARVGTERKITRRGEHKHGQGKGKALARCTTWRRAEMEHRVGILSFCINLSSAWASARRGGPQTSSRPAAA